MAVDERYGSSAFIRGRYLWHVHVMVSPNCYGLENRRLRNMTSALIKLYLVSAGTPRSVNMRYATETSSRTLECWRPKSNVEQTRALTTYSYITTLCLGTQPSGHKLDLTIRSWSDTTLNEQNKAACNVLSPQTSKEGHSTVTVQVTHLAFPSQGNRLTDGQSHTQSQSGFMGVCGPINHNKALEWKLRM